MTERTADERIDALERLVLKALCKCTFGPYWRAFNNCPVHSQLDDWKQKAGDQVG